MIVSRKKKQALLKKTDDIKTLLLKTDSKVDLHIKGINEYLSATEKVSLNWKNKVS